MHARLNLLASPVGLEHDAPLAAATALSCIGPPGLVLPTEGTALTRAAVATGVLWWTARRRVAWT